MVDHFAGHKSAARTYQRYPKVLNKVGDTVIATWKDDGATHSEKAEIIAIYERYVLLWIKGKYKTTASNDEFAEFKGAKIDWNKIPDEF